jgi:uncharacterized membrane protein YvbJ
MSDINETTTEIDGKTISKKSMVVAAIWIGGLTLIKGVLFIFGKQFLDMSDIITSGIAITAVFIPIPISVWLEKIKDIRTAK